MESRLGPWDVREKICSGFGPVAPFGYKADVQHSKLFPWLQCFVPVVSLFACGGAVEPVPKAPSVAEPAEPTLPALPAGHVWRVQVMELMSPGLGAFLQRISVIDVQERGHFRGFRIERLQGNKAFWEGVDLKPGDIVSRVNGESIGHYDQAYAVWQSLATAPEIVISYERAGEQRQLKFVIHDEDPSGKTPPPVIATPPAAVAASAKPAPAPVNSAVPAVTASSSTAKPPVQNAASAGAPKGK